jgi:cyanate permease
MALAGVGHALAMLAVGVLLTRAVSVRRHGLAFGVAQAAAPLAALLAGLSVPAIGLTLGWRAVFVLAAALGLLAAVMTPPVARRPSTVGSAGVGDTPVRVLVPLAIGMALASAGANSSVIFLVPSTVDRGFSAADAGLVLAVASLVGLTVRVGSGWLGDRIHRGALLLMAGLIAIGAAGYAGLAFSALPALIVLFATFALGGGWGWPGLMLLAVSRSNPGAPGAAMGVVTVGGLTGAVAGPIAFGAIAQHVGFSASWLLIAGLAGGAILMTLVSGRLILRVRGVLP